jgi:hypothetical protein
MDVVARAAFSARLRRQSTALSRAWQRAIAPTGFANFDSDEVRQQLVGLTERLMTLLLDEAAPAAGAQEIGAAVARLHYVQPDALGQTQAVLAQHLLPELHRAERGSLELRLVHLLSELGTGFSRQVRSMLLSEQETIRAAFLEELNKAALTQAQQYARRNRRAASCAPCWMPPRTGCCSFPTNGESWRSTGAMRSCSACRPPPL